MLRTGTRSMERLAPCDTASARSKAHVKQWKTMLQWFPKAYVDSSMQVEAVHRLAASNNFPLRTTPHRSTGTLKGTALLSNRVLPLTATAFQEYLMATRDLAQLPFSVSICIQQLASSYNKLQRKKGTLLVSCWTSPVELYLCVLPLSTCARSGTAASYVMLEDWRAMQT